MPMAGRYFREERQLHTLHRGLDSPQRMAANRDFVRSEDQAKPLLIAIALEFGEGELIERQQQALFR